MTAFNWADWALLAIIALSCLMSLKRGFIREALSLVIWVLAFIIARSFHPQAQTLLAPWISDPFILIVAAFVALFVGTLLLGAAINFILAALIRMTGLSPLDRLLGVFFGLARGLILTVVLVAVFRLSPLSETQWWRESQVIEQLALLEQWSRSVFERHTS